MKTELESAFVIRVARGLLAGKYLQGPLDAKQVRRDGYGFTDDPAQAWPFQSEKQAAAKEKVVARHMDFWPGDTVVEQA
jgi:hypothetical protein